MGTFDSISNAAQAVKNAVYPAPPKPITQTTDIAEVYEEDNYLSGGESETKAFGLGGDSDQFFHWRTARTAFAFAQNFGYELVMYNTKTSFQTRMPLPINPQQIQISIPAATSTTVTMKGIVEESNGAPLRQIRISGTTGIIPMGNFTPLKKGPSSIGQEAIDAASYLFRNAIRSATGVVNQASKTVSAFGGSAQKMTYLNYAEDKVKYGSEFVTGYDFFHRLARFLDFYLAAKKDNPNMRLALHMYKDQMYYDVVLNGYDFMKGQGTLEYNYNLALTAYRRRSDPVGALALSPASISSTSVQRLNVLAAIMNGVRESRLLITQVQGFYNSYILPIIKGGLAGFYSTFLEGYVSEISRLIYELHGRNLEDAIDWVPVLGASTLLASSTSSPQNNIPSAGSIDNTNQGSATADIYAPPGYTGGVAGSILVTNDGDLAHTDPNGNKSIDNGTHPMSGIVSPGSSQNIATAALIQILQGVTLDSLRLDAKSMALIEAERARLNLLTADDMRAKKADMESFVAAVSESLGGGNSVYNRMNGLPNPKSNYHTMGTADIEILDKLNDILMAYDALIYYMDNIPSIPDNGYLDYWAAQAQANSIPFQNSSSVFYAPVPHGASLESIALTYLGNADRWVEIVAVNALKPPYIDEDGIQIPFIGSGSGNSFMVAAPDNLYIGQKITITSPTGVPTLRKVISINVLSASETLITVDGNSDLSQFPIIDAPYIKAYLPGTINSNNLIAIPSNNVASPQNKYKTIPGVEDLNGMVRIAKTDFLLDSGGDYQDIVVGSYGDIGIAYGLTNLIQAAMIKIKTKYLSLVNDPGFGNTAEAGVSVAEVDAKRYINDLNTMFAADPRFGALQAVGVTIDGPAMSVNISVQISNTGVYLPIEARVPL